jgi:hypothetical protein
MPERNPVPVAPDSTVLGARLGQIAAQTPRAVNQTVTIGLHWRLEEDAVSGNLVAVYGPTGTSVVLAAMPTS